MFKLKTLDTPIASLREDKSTLTIGELQQVSMLLEQLQKPNVEVPYPRTGFCYNFYHLTGNNYVLNHIVNNIIPAILVNMWPYHSGNKEFPIPSVNYLGEGEIFFGKKANGVFLDRNVDPRLKPNKWTGTKYSELRKNYIHYVAALFEFSYASQYSEKGFTIFTLKDLVRPLKYLPHFSLHGLSILTEKTINRKLDKRLPPEYDKYIRS